MINSATRRLFVGAILMGSILTGLTISAAAASMTCQNPRRAYNVSFTMQPHRMIVTADGDAQEYPIRSVTDGREGYVVRGLTTIGGPPFVAYFGGKRRMEYSIAKNTKQVDLCR